MNLRNWIACIILGSAVSMASASTDDTCREFLGHFIVTYPASSGTQIEFTGEFMPIEAPMVARLTKEFEDYDFRIARMRYLHWGMDPVNLLLVVHRGDSRVCTYLWDVWFTDEPFSFGTVFGRIRHSEDKAAARLGLLAELICYQMGWSAGEVTTNERVISVPLLNRDKVSWRILLLRLDLSLEQRNLVFINPKQQEATSTKPP